MAAPSSQWRAIRFLAWAGAMACAAGAVMLLGFFVYAAWLPPLDLAALQARSPIVVDRNGALLRPFAMADGRWRLPLTLGEVDPRYIDMLIAYEDRRFYQHSGVDPRGLARAAWQWLRHGRVVSGGSTLSMQVARLAEPRAGRSLGAKLRQIARAIELERRLGKKGILELYLALAPFGGNIEGVRAASLTYFGREPRRLSTAEAALLVAIPQAPEQRRPDRFEAKARGARGRVLARMGETGLLPAADLTRAASADIPSARRAFPHHAAHRAEALLAAWPGQSRIETTFDLAWQRDLEKLALERAEALDPQLSVAIVVIESETGAVRASLGGPDYLSEARRGGIDLSRAIRSPGSALKPFIYAFAFEEGLAHPETLLEDRPLRFGAYAPENFDPGFQGPVSAREALQQSLNLPAVDLLAALGPQRFLTWLRQAKAEIRLPDASPPGLAIGLGGLGISLHDLTGLYAHLARGGHMVPPYELKPAAGHNGPLSPALPAARIVGPVSAYYIADILLGAAPPENGLSNRIAFKTGTSYGYRDAFAIGFDRKHTIGIWVGRADNAAVPGLVARKVAAPILFDAFSRIGLMPGSPTRPRDALIARNGALPPPLRHRRPDLPKTQDALASPPLQIAFPPNGASIDAKASAIEGKPYLAVKLIGGVAPFTYLVNGVPIEAASARRQSGFVPDGLGFAQISVIDARGATDKVDIRLQ